jgi:hypothetical protein
VSRKAEIKRLLVGLRIVQGFLGLERAKPVEQRSRAVVDSAQATAEVLLARWEKLKLKG